MQLRSILADQRGRDSLISAGTGSGKTLPIALCTLLDDPTKKKVTIVVSPLKRLQKSQANEFTIILEFMLSLSMKTHHGTPPGGP